VSQRRLRSITLFAILALAGSPLFAQSWANQPETERKIEALLKRMTLEEKVGQLNQYSAGSPTGPGTDRSNYEEMIEKGAVGALFNVSGPQVNEYQKIAVEKSRLKIPLVYGLDVIHGFRTTFPIPLAMSATWDPGLIEKAARVAATEASAGGVRWVFSPMVDIARDARWGRIAESAGEDPYLGSVIARAFVRGYQGNLLADPSSVAACAKHFVGYGAAEAGRDYNSTEISERTLRAIYLPPFHAAEEEGAASFMSAFNAINGVPASANAFTLDKILRKEWAFRGVVDSDWMSVGELIPHGIALDKADAARKALLAGVDMDMESDSYHVGLAAEVKAGRVPISAVDEAVRRVLRMKFALGLFEHPYANLDPSAMLKPESVELSRTIAEQSFVLLKNEGVLPLKAGSKVALIGPLADNAPEMLGSWAAVGDPQNVVTLKASLAERIGKPLLFAPGTEIRTTSEAGFADAVKAAQQADVVVIALGERAAEMTGEAASRAHLRLPGNQEKLLEAVAATGKPVVLIVFSGRPLVLDKASEHASAILEAWHPGIQAGAALVRTLYGESNPSGKLTATFPRAVGQEPLYYNHLSTGRPLGTVPDSDQPLEGLDKFHSRYIDEKVSPLYPFGFGLSYTTFAYKPPTLSRPSINVSEILAGKTITVSAELRNTGSVAGTEIAQLYIGQTGTSVALPVRELKGFQKVKLQPGERKTVEFTIAQEQLAFWNLDMKHTVEPALVKIWIAGSSADGTPVELVLR
jgi:beta-glucosidase